MFPNTSTQSLDQFNDCLGFARQLSQSPIVYWRLEVKLGENSFAFTPNSCTTCELQTWFLLTPFTNTNQSDPINPKPGPTTTCLLTNDINPSWGRWAWTRSTRTWTRSTEAWTRTTRARTRYNAMTHAIFESMCARLQRMPEPDQQEPEQEQAWTRTTRAWTRL